MKFTITNSDALERRIAQDLLMHHLDDVKKKVETCPPILLADLLRLQHRITCKLIDLTECQIRDVLESCKENFI